MTSKQLIRPLRVGIALVFFWPLMMATPPASAVPVAVGEGVGSGWSNFRGVEGGICDLYTEAGFDIDLFMTTLVITDPGGNQGEAEYTGDLAVSLNSTDTAWHSDGTTWYRSPDPTPQDGNACVGNVPGHGVAIAGTLTEPSATAAPGTVSCWNLLGEFRYRSAGVCLQCEW